MSCDNIGSFVKPHFAPEFKQDPYHIPGYQGFVPQFKYQSEGKTFGNATKSLFENPCVASSGKLVIADVGREDAGSIIKPGFECQVWEAEMKKCREIQKRCLPGCYDKSPAQYPQSYQNFLQPANVFYDECRQGKPEAHREGGRVGDAQFVQLATTDCGVTLPRLADSARHAEGDDRRCAAARSARRLPADRDANQKRQLKKQFLICPSQTIYDPKTDCRYFMFSQQNTRNCGQIAPRPVPAGNCVSMATCKEICPCPQTQLKIRQLYPECGGMMSGYGGHVPGLNDCTLGDNYKKATAKVLKQVVGGKREYPGPWTLKLPDCRKKHHSGTKCGRNF